MRLGKIFREMDVNKNGFLTIDNIKGGLHRIKDEVKDIMGKHPDWDLIFKKMDVNGDGLVDYNEFVSALYDTRKIMSDKNLKAAFQSIDTDNSGSITLDEL